MGGCEPSGAGSAAGSGALNRERDEHGNTRWPTSEGRYRLRVCSDMPLVVGPLSWMNWRAQLSGESSGSQIPGYEALLFTDASITGFGIHDDIGPYRLTNALRCFGAGVEPSLGPGLGLHVEMHIDPQEASSRPPPLAKATGSAQWIGLSVDQEIACLLSLILGVRFQSTGPARIFDDTSPMGRPLFADYHEPILPPVYSSRRMLPGWAGRQVDLLSARDRFRSFVELCAEDAVALIRAAREYASAVWIAESDPDFSWLLLVSAIEVVASRWRVSSVDALAAFQENYPDLATEVSMRGDAELLQAIAENFHHLVKSTRKFLDFCERFLPGPPEQPSPWPGLDWSDKADFRRRLRVIYDHRSKRLHDAVPFPSSLTSPGPLLEPTDEPIGLGSANAYSSWQRTDTPLTFYAFTHLTRGVILGWWDECTNRTSA
jgi:hypothetical protein